MLVLSGCNFAYLSYYQGQPVGWGCNTIHYRIDITGMPNLAWAQDIHDAFRAASAASGIPVHYDGRLSHSTVTSHQWQSSVGDPVWVFYKPFDDPPSSAGGYTDPTFSNHHIVGGEIMFNTLTRWNRTLHRRVAFHEVGHIFGLAHVTSDATSVVMGYHNAPYQYGDIVGLRGNGRPSNC